MSILVDLFPTVRSYSDRAERLEDICEYIDETDAPFSKKQIFKAVGLWGYFNDVELAIDNMLAVGLIERVSEPKSRPMFYCKAGAA